MATLIPQIRKRTFEFTPDIPRHWAAGDAAKTQWSNAFSVVLPAYERFFIAIISRHVNQISDASLKQQARDFCVQEGQHARAHRDYNLWLVGLGYSALPRVDNFLNRVLRAFEKVLPSAWLTALAAGGEHITSFMAHDYLSYPEKWSLGSHPTLDSLWKWHAAEEIEHKAVCFDVYREIYGGSIAQRVFFFVALSQALFLVVMIQTYLLWKDGVLFKLSTWVSETRVLFGRGGFITGVLREGLKYMMPGFHPWKTEDAELVRHWEMSL